MFNWLLKNTATSQKAASTTKTVLRSIGEPLNTLGHPRVTENIIHPTFNRTKKFSICRCWKSERFPYCDNTHQVLQQQGIECGPALLEFQKSTLERVAEPTNPNSQSAPNGNPFKTAAIFLVGGVTGFMTHFTGWC